ncbi:MAG: hypothetical protein ANABAC_0961 [Anaerolineae bacterium]|nr:MAG: hypothetical protein ANABAC_0961 [Anaerolineae bacterium]
MDYTQALKKCQSKNFYIKVAFSQFFYRARALPRSVKAMQANVIRRIEMRFHVLRKDFSLQKSG